VGGSRRDIYWFTAERQNGDYGLSVNKLAIVTSVLALAVSSAKAQTSIWITDPAHSEVDFITRRFDMTDVSGRFGRVTGELDLNEADVTRSVVKMTIDLASVDTKDQVRDEHGQYLRDQKRQ
jgi:polyisoprenoid-binding protein YceI